jgi:hypothetical protein
LEVRTLVSGLVDTKCVGRQRFRRKVGEAISAAISVIAEMTIGPVPRRRSSPCTSISGEDAVALAPTDAFAGEPSGVDQTGRLARRLKGLAPPVGIRGGRQDRRCNCAAVCFESKVILDATKQWDKYPTLT